MTRAVLSIGSNLGDRLGLELVRVDEWRRGEVLFPSVRVSLRTPSHFEPQPLSLAKMAVAWTRDVALIEPSFAVPVASRNVR